MHEQIQQAVKQFQGGDLAGAKTIINKYLLNKPDDIDANMLIAAIYAANSDYEMVIQACNNILQLSPSHPRALYNAAVASQCLSNHENVIDYCLKLLAIEPENIHASLMAISALYDKGDVEKAISRSQSTIKKSANNAEIILQISRVFRSKKAYQLAREVIQKSTATQPLLPALVMELAWIDIELTDIQSAESHLQSIVEEYRNKHEFILLQATIYRLKNQFKEGVNYLENRLTKPDNMTAALVSELARLSMCMANYEKARQLYEYNINHQFNLAESHHNLGNIFELLGEYDNAINSYQRVLSIAPGSAATLYNLSLVYEKKAEYSLSMKYIRLCLTCSRNNEFLQTYIRLLAKGGSEIAGQVNKDEIIELVSDAECDCQSLSNLVIGILKLSSIFNDLIEYAHEDEYQKFIQLMQAEVSREVSSNSLFLCYLLNISVTSYSFEKFIGMCRRWLLDFFVHHEDEFASYADLCAALGVQCYVTGYILSTSKQEHDVISSLKDLYTQQGGTNKELYLLSVISMYCPIYSLPSVKPVEIDVCSEIQKRLIKIQLLDRIDEDKLYDSIKSPFEIDDQMSIVVRNQYEEHPYPVWDHLAVSQPRPINEIINDIAPFHDNTMFAFSNPEVLIAGCGTGSHSILSAMKTQSKSITAIDLSKRSLAFAIRKADEYGISRLNFMHMDILKLPELGRTFDIIESIGVIHHMDNPGKGLECLVSCLRQGGLINLAVYSTLARKHIKQAKSLYDRQDRRITDDEIRSARRLLMASDDNELVLNLSSLTDFYALQECRDLIFHECEHDYRMHELEQLISGCGLEFLGFDLPDRLTSTIYRKMFPDDKNMTSFKNWNELENRYPDTFTSMYNFWCYKK